MATDSKRNQLTEQKLVNGWAAATKIKVRLARPTDMAAVRELAALAGVRLEDELIAALVDDMATGAIRAGLRGGQAAFTRDTGLLARRARPGQPKGRSSMTRMRSPRAPGDQPGAKGRSCVRSSSGMTRRKGAVDF